MNTRISNPFQPSTWRGHIVQRTEAAVRGSRFLHLWLWCHSPDRPAFAHINALDSWDGSYQACPLCEWSVEHLQGEPS